MSNAAYDIGDEVELALDLSGLADPPDDVRLILLRPNGGFVVLALSDDDSDIAHDGEGTYSVRLQAEHSGPHDYRWEVVGAAAQASEGRYYVRLSTLAGQGG
jgi:hypothetical protein